MDESPAGFIGSVRKLVHDTSSALIDAQITTRLSDFVSGTVKSGFDVIENVLTVVKDLTKPNP